MRVQYFFKRLLAHDRRGTTAIEYGVIVGLIALVVTTAVSVEAGSHLSFITTEIARAVEGLPPVPYSMP